MVTGGTPPTTHAAAAGSEGDVSSGVLDDDDDAVLELARAACASEAVRAAASSAAAEAESEEALARLAYFYWLERVRGVAWHGERIEAYVVRQPWSLSRRFAVAHACERFVAVDKPWAVRLDVPKRGVAAPPLDVAAQDWVEMTSTPVHGPAHQLDHATSGVLLFGRNHDACAAASAAFRDRTAEKEYVLVVFGHPDEDAFEVDQHVGPDKTCPRGFNMCCTAAGKKAGGKPARTRFEVVARGLCGLQGPHEGKPVARLIARPETGRRHQIRVHAAYAGHPIVGDAAYAGDEDTFRLFLHARSLRLPTLDPPLAIEAAVPPEFLAAVAAGTSPAPTKRPRVE